MRCSMYNGVNTGVELQCIGHFKLLFSLLRVDGRPRMQQHALEVSMLLEICYVFTAGFPRILESSGFFLENSRTWKVMENHLGPGKSWKLKLKVLESSVEISLKVIHFSSGSNGKQAAIV